MRVTAHPAVAATIRTHLDAVINRDLDTYLSTIHPAVTVIITSGARLTGKDEVAEFHREWFADPEWTYETTQPRTSQVGDVATAVVEVTYRGRPDAEPTRFVMGLVFVREDSKWLLIHDQCTVLRTE